MFAFDPHGVESGEILISSVKKTKYIVASCPGKRIPIRSSASTKGDIIGYISSGDALLVNKKTTAGFYQLVDQMGFFNKSTRDVEWIEQEHSILPSASVPFQPIEYSSSPHVDSDVANAAANNTNMNNSDFDSSNTTGNVSTQSDQKVLLSKIDELAMILKKYETDMKLLSDQQVETVCKLERVEADNKLHLTKIKSLEKEVEMMKVEKVAATLPTLTISSQQQQQPAHSHSQGLQLQLPSTTEMMSSPTPFSPCSPPFSMLLSPFQTDHHNTHNNHHFYYHHHLHHQDDYHLPPPEKCSGHIQIENLEGDFESMFFELSMGILCVFKRETMNSAVDGVRQGEEKVQELNLKGCNITFPGLHRILLQPPMSTANDSINLSNMLLQVINTYEFNNWETALYEHLCFINPNVYFPRVPHQLNYIKQHNVSSMMNGLMFQKVEENSNNNFIEGKIANESGKENSNNNDDIHNTNEATSSIAIVLDEYIDKRGIKYSTQSSQYSKSTTDSGSGGSFGIKYQAKTKYADLTLEILRNQLRKDGKTPLEFIPLQDIKQEISVLFQKANEGMEYDEGRLEYLLTCMDLNPEYRAEKERETAAWRAEIEPYAKECLAIMRGFISSHIFTATPQSLIHEGMTAELAKRVLTKKCLWLIRISTADIAKMHIAELQGRFNPEAQGLDIIELAAIFANTPKKFANDDCKGSKERWRLSLEECVKSFYTQLKNQTLAKIKVRNPIYSNLKIIYNTQDECHNMDVTVSEAFGSSTSNRQLSPQRLVQHTFV